ncbi:hypothetical protein D1007_10376 [Hordeum vulgare]|nr:hypothetical protein D1007_10376 [Hordeum vulgare]
MPNPCSYALILDPTISSKRLTCRFSRVLVDGGSNINILYRDTLLKLGLREKDLQLTRTMFHGIVPGPTLGKFIATPHYASLKMKMVGPKRIITVSSNYKKPIECAHEVSGLAEALVIVEENASLTGSWPRPPSSRPVDSLILAS